MSYIDPRGPTQAGSASADLQHMLDPTVLQAPRSC